MNEEKNKLITILDQETGQIYERSIVELLEDIGIKVDTYKELSVQQKAFKAKKQDEGDVINTLGKFYLNYYGNTICHKHLLRFAYINTFTEYSTNYITIGKGSNSYIKKTDLQEILKLSKKPFYETINYLFENELLQEDKDGYLKINDKYCIRGSMDKDIQKGKGVIRMFDNSIKELYENSNPREHERIGLLLKLIPHINYKWNVICKNPTEADIEKIIPLKKKEIEDILQIKDNKLITNITTLKIMNGNESAFAKLTNAFVKNAYMINPRLMYRSRSKEEIEELLTWFKLGSHKK